MARCDERATGLGLDITSPSTPLSQGKLVSVCHHQSSLLHAIAALTVDLAAAPDPTRNVTPTASKASELVFPPHPPSACCVVALLQMGFFIKRMPSEGQQ